MSNVRCGFLDDGGRPLYLAHHGVASHARGTVVMCGGLALEATHAAPVWNRWARQLAAAGWNSVRFDWQGMGESSGRFADVTFGDWTDDVRRVCAALRGIGEQSIVLLGLRGGALPAAHVFAEGTGDAIVLWEAPASGRAHLMDVLRRRLAGDYARTSDQSRKTRDEYAAEILAGKPVEVEGFIWSRRFWESLCAVNLPEVGCERPRLVLASRTHGIQRPPFWQDIREFHPDVSAWTQATLGFLGTLARPVAPASGSLTLASVARMGEIDREIIGIECGATELVATRHVPRVSRHVGVVLLNFGYAPRSGHGGLAVSICDELASLGIDAFRVDLPALGDSGGELPASFGDWAGGVRAGTMTTVTVAALEALQRDFALTNIAVGGLCAASITALYAYEMRPKLVSALVLLEPELFAATVTEELSPSTTSPQPNRVRQELLSKMRGIFSDWGWMRLLAGEHELLHHLPIPRRLLHHALTFMSSALPDHTNRRLVEAWQGAARSRVPMLVVTAEGKMRELFLDRVNAIAVPEYTLLSSPGRAITHVRIPNTNHTFTSGNAIDKLPSIVGNWATGRFPAIAITPPRGPD